MEKNSSTPPAAGSDKVEKITIETVTMAALRAASFAVEIVDGLAQSFTKKVKALSTARDTVKTCTKRFAIVACALKMRLETAQQNNTESRSTTLSDYIERIAGRKPSNHELTLANSYGSFVESVNPATMTLDADGKPVVGTGTPFLTEEQWLGNSGNADETAQKIVVAVKGDLSNPAVAQAATILANVALETKEKAKQLRELLLTLVPKEKASAEDVENFDAADLTADAVLVIFGKLVQAGFLGLMLADVPDEIEKLPENGQLAGYVACAQLLRRVETKFGDKAETWADAHRTNESGVQVVPSTVTPDAVNAALTAEMAA